MSVVKKRSQQMLPSRDFWLQTQAASTEGHFCAGSLTIFQHLSEMEPSLMSSFPFVIVSLLTQLNPSSVVLHYYDHLWGLNYSSQCWDATNCIYLTLRCLRLTWAFPCYASSYFYSKVNIVPDLHDLQSLIGFLRCISPDVLVLNVCVKVKDERFLLRLRELLLKIN